MTVSLTQLLTPMTQDQAVSLMIAELQSQGFNATAWQTGSKQRALLEMAGLAWADVTTLIATLVSFGFNTLATGRALTELSKSHYNNTRSAAVKTQGTLLLTDTGNTGPHAISLSQLVAQETQTPDGWTYRNITVGTVPLGGTKELTFEAETAGSVQNVGLNVITKLTTPVAGLTVNNPDPGSGTWITQTGADQEADDALELRNLTKWGLLSIAVPSDGYKNLALQVAGVARVEVDATNPSGPGTVDVYIAGPSGISSGADVTAVQALIDQRRPVSAQVTAKAAASISLAVTGTVYILAASDSPAKRSAIENSVIAYIDSIPISGLDLSPGPATVLPRSGIVDAIHNNSGVQSVSLTSPALDVTVSLHRIVEESSVTFTYVVV